MCFGFEGQHVDAMDVAAIANVRKWTDEQVREALIKEFPDKLHYVDYYVKEVGMYRNFIRRESLAT
jgi:hypothetical protein